MSEVKPTRSSEAVTRASIFVKLNGADPAPRELAWKQFYEFYAPVVSGYARQRGASPQQADEVVQNVISGFFEASPRFVYDPSRGRFRAYLRTCATHALERIRSASRASHPVPVEEMEATPVESENDELWDRLWRQQILRRALDLAREHYSLKGNPNTFLAFEKNVLEGVSAQQCADDLGINVASVHQAKTRVTEKLKEIRAILTEEEG
jgi:RNA polymerase sigma-70 factor (ECF subfamily)